MGDLNKTISNLNLSPFADTYVLSLLNPTFTFSGRFQYDYN